MSNVNIKKSYINKEDFVKMIQDLPFDCVSACSLDLVTGFIIEKEDEDHMRAVGYNFRIGEQWEW